MIDDTYFVREIEVFPPHVAEEFLNAIKNAPDELWRHSSVISPSGTGKAEEIKQHRNHRTSDLWEYEDHMSGLAKEAGDFLVDGAGPHLYNKYDNMLKEGHPDFVYAHTVLSNSPWQLSEYGAGEFYNFHIDECAEPESSWDLVDENNPSEGYSQVVKRTLSAVLYLNNDFEGGETCFAWGTKYKPAPGTALVFPSAWPFVHSGSPVISGHKYIALSWINCGTLITRHSKP